MLNLPKLIIDQQDPFAGCFYGVTTWAKAQILLIGVLLTPGRRRVSEALRVMGLSASPAFAQYHQVLNRAVWSPLALPIRWVLLRDPQGRYESIALLCTDPVVSPAAIPAWFVQGWQLEVTFEEARRHLGLETQRQWADQAIGRTTPLLLGLFSWITLVAAALYAAQPAPAPRHAVWYAKTLPTFVDALAQVRQTLWTAYPTFQTSLPNAETVKISKPLFDTLISTRCYAA